MDESGGTDADLLDRVARGDHRALSVVFDRHAPAVTRYAWALATGRSEVEEIVQDTFVTMWRKAGEIALAEASLLPWLLVTCKYLALNAARRAAKHEADELDETRADGMNAVRDHDDAETARDDLRWVLAEIQALEPMDRRVCELCLIDGLPYADAARELGLSVGAVKQRVSRSRARLRKAVTVDEV